MKLIYVYSYLYEYYLKKKGEKLWQKNFLF